MGRGLRIGLLLFPSCVKRLDGVKITITTHTYTHTSNLPPNVPYKISTLLPLLSGSHFLNLTGTSVISSCVAMQGDPQRHTVDMFASAIMG